MTVSDFSHALKPFNSIRTVWSPALIGLSTEYSPQTSIQQDVGAVGSRLDGYRCRRFMCRVMRRHWRDCRFCEGCGALAPGVRV